MAEGEENMEEREGQNLPQEVVSGANEPQQPAPNIAPKSKHQSWKIPNWVRGPLAGLALFGATATGRVHAQENPDEPQPTPIKLVGDSPPNPPELETAGAAAEGEEVQAPVEGAPEESPEESAEPEVVAETVVRFQASWTSNSNLEFNGEQQAFVNEKLADWLQTMHNTHPELDRLATLFEEANKMSGNERARAYLVPTSSRDIALTDFRTWYNTVVFSPLSDASEKPFSDLFFYYDAFAVGRGHDSPLDFALAIYNWQTAKEMLDSGIPASEVVRIWNSAEVVGIYADNMDKVINVYREIRDSRVLSDSELDTFSGFWDDPFAILKARYARDRRGWLSVVRTLMGFKYSNSDLSVLA